MASDDITVEILRGIRDEVRALRSDTNTKLDALGARIDDTNARLDVTNERATRRSSPKVSHGWSPA